MTDVLSGPPVAGILTGPVTSPAPGRDAHAATRTAMDRDAHARSWFAPGRDPRPLPAPPTGGHARTPRPLTATHVTAPKEHGHG